MKKLITILFIIIVSNIFGQYTYNQAYKCYSSYPDIIPQNRRANWVKAGTDNCQPSTYTNTRTTQGIQHILNADDYSSLDFAISALNSLPEDESKLLLLSNKTYYLDTPVILNSNTIISGVSSYPGTTIMYRAVYTGNMFTIIGTTNDT